MAGNRKHGFMQGSANGRNGSNQVFPWFCSGCGKEHGSRVSRNKILDGLDYCDRQYDRKKELEFARMNNKQLNLFDSL